MADFRQFDDNKLVREYADKDVDRDQFFHSSAYAQAQNGGTFGVASGSGQSFDVRQQMERDRKFVQGYGNSQMVTGIRDNEIDVRKTAQTDSGRVTSLRRNKEGDVNGNERIGYGKSKNGADTHRGYGRTAGGTDGNVRTFYGRTGGRVAGSNEAAKRDFTARRGTDHDFGGLSLGSSGIKGRPTPPTPTGPKLPWR